MCLLAILWRAIDDAPLVVAANREESYARGGTPPDLVEGTMRFVGGLDPRAGGTWLGVNARGLLVAVTNRGRSRLPPQPRSRGLLARDLLQRPTAAEAVQEAARELDKGVYAGCNLLIADRDAAYIVHHGDWLRVNPLPAGVHAIATGDVNNGVDPRIAFTLDFLSRKHWQSAGECLDALQGLCARREQPPICLLGEKGGTVSSSLIALRDPVQRSTFRHAQGPPDRTPYEDLSHLFCKLD